MRPMGGGDIAAAPDQKMPPKGRQKKDGVICFIVFITTAAWARGEGGLAAYDRGDFIL